MVLFWEKLLKGRKFKLNDFRNTKNHNIFANWNPYTRGLTFQNFLIYQFINNNGKDFINFKKKINNLNIGNSPSINFNNKYKVSIDDCLSFEEVVFLKKNLKKTLLNKKINVLEVGGGYGRSCEEIIKNFNINTYTIIDYKKVSIISKKYLKRVLTDKEYKKILFLDFVEFNFRKNYFDGKIFDLFVNIDSFHELESRIINKYLNYFKDINNFYIKNAVNKYRPRDLINHLDNSAPPSYNLKLGLNKKIINIFDKNQLERSRKDYIKNYNPFGKKHFCHSEFSKIFNFYLHCLFTR